jgi:hypothetical protein
MPSTRTAGLVAVICLLALGACDDSACYIGVPERFPEPPATSYDTATFQIQIQTQSEAVEGARVTPEFFRSTGVRAQMGRLFVPEEYNTAGMGIVLISYDWWQKRLDGSPGAVGTTIQLDGRPAVIVGILEPSFRVPKQANLWVPKRFP